MKYAIVIPDGAADDPQPALGGQTPLQAARLDNLNRLARAGQLGLTNNVPKALLPGSDVAILSLLGYDPLRYYTGRAPLEAAAMGLALGPNDWAIRCNLVHVEGGEMRDFTAEHIDSAAAKQLIAALQKAIGSWQWEFHAGVSYRNLLICRSGQAAPFADDTLTWPPHDIPDRPLADYGPTGPGAEVLRGLMERSRIVLTDHEVNQARRRAGRRDANQIWLWGLGQAPQMPRFQELHGVNGALVAAVDLVRGIGMLAGWECIDVPGATGYLDTDYAAKGRAAVDALQCFDLVCVHVEAPDEASHEGRVDAKVAALEAIDRDIVGPLAEALASFGHWRILVAPDHRTTLSSRTHARGTVPFLLAGTGIDASGIGNEYAAFHEFAAAASPLRFDPGYTLLAELFRK